MGLAKSTLARETSFGSTAAAGLGAAVAILAGERAQSKHRRPQIDVREAGQLLAEQESEQWSDKPGFYGRR